MVETETKDLRGAHVHKLPKRNRIYDAGRVCAAEGCSTLLSIYNRSKLCWVHEPVHTYVQRDLAGRKPKQQAA